MNGKEEDGLLIQDRGRDASGFIVSCHILSSTHLNLLPEIVRCQKVLDLELGAKSFGPPF